MTFLRMTLGGTLHELLLRKIAVTMTLHLAKCHLAEYCCAIHNILGRIIAII